MVTLPYHNNLSTLNDLTIINGNWSTGSTPSGGSLAFTSVGTDYCGWGKTLDLWTQYKGWSIAWNNVTYNFPNGHIDLIDFYHAQRIDKVAFSFNFNLEDTSGNYDPDKLEWILQQCAQRGVKVSELVNGHDWDGQYQGDGYLGSPKMTNDWLEFAQRWKGDNRFIAVRFYQEPQGYIDNGLGTGQIAWHSSLQNDPLKLIKYLVDLTNAYHAIDPDRMIIFPYMGLSCGEQSTLVSWFESQGAFNIGDKVMYDIIHPYFFQYAPWGLDMQASLNSFSEYIQPWIARVGASKCYCGETFIVINEYDLWETVNGVSVKVHVVPDPVKARTWMTEMINILIRNKVGFNYWCVLSATPNYIVPGDSYSVATENLHCLENSVYAGPYP